VTWTFPCTIPLPGESPRDCTSGAVTTDIADYTLFSVADVAEVDVVLKVVRVARPLGRERRRHDRAPD